MTTSSPKHYLQLFVLMTILIESSCPADVYNNSVEVAIKEANAIEEDHYRWWRNGNCSNLGVEDSERDWFATCWIVTSVIQATLLLLGLSNNILNIVCFRSDKAQLVQNELLISLSVCDWFIVLIMSIDSVCHVVANVDGVPMPVHWTCVYLHPFPITGLQFALLTVHGWTTVALAMVRFIAVRFPFKSRTLITRRRIRLVAGFVWVAGMASGLPRLTDTFAVVCTDRIGAFLVGRSQFPLYSTVHTWGLQVALPVGLCILLNVQVLLAVTCGAQQPESSQDEAKRQSSVTRMVLAMTTIYIICQSFTVLFFLNTVLEWKRAAFELLNLFGNIAYSLDACLSFFVYVITNASFRMEAKRRILKLFSIMKPQLAGGQSRSLTETRQVSYQVSGAEVQAGV